MITITRRLARQVRAVFRKALHVNRGVGPPLRVLTNENGLWIRSQTADRAVEYHQPGEFPVQTLRLPLEFLNDCAGGREDPVELESAGENQAMARWTHRGIPAIVRYDVPEEPPPFPARPQKMTDQEPRLLAALQDASRTCDPSSTRYALGCVALGGDTGEIAATDACQLLIQRGFSFPWNDQVLIPDSRIWECRELAEVVPLALGQTPEAVAVQIGPWCVWLQIVREARFPKLGDYVPNREAVMATVELAEGDARFLTEALRELPDSEAALPAVTLDLNGEVIVRAKAEDRPPTDVVLRHSRTRGTNLRVSTDRRFLARAASLGFRRIHFTEPEAPAFCQDAARTFVWALLEKDGVFPPDPASLRMESPPAEERSTHSQSEEPNPAMTRNPNATRPLHQDVSNPSQTSEGNGIEALLEHAESLHATLREAATRARDLINVCPEMVLIRCFCGG